MPSRRAISGNETDIMTMKLHGTDRTGKDFGRLIGSVSLMVVIASALILFGTAGTSDGAVGDTQIIGGLEYEITGSSEVELVSFSVEPTSSLDIPSTVTIDGSTYSVTSIGERAFFNCSGITEVTLGSNIESVGEAAFAGCTGIEEISFESENFPSVEYGSFATGSYFYVTTPGWSPYAVLNDDSLMIMSSDGAYSGTAVWINPPSQTIGTMFEYSGFVFVFNSPFTVMVGSSLTEKIQGRVTIPETVYYDGADYAVTVVADYGFENCTGITDLVIPPTITYIEDNAFAGCTGLDFVAIPGYVEYIDDCAFQGCTALESIYLNSGTKGLGPYAFEGCISLSRIDIPDTVTNIGIEAFSGCSSLTSVVFDHTVPPTMGVDSFATGTTIHVKTSGWDPVSAMTGAIDEYTTVVWADAPLRFLSNPIEDGIIAPLNRKVLIQPVMI